MISKSGSGKSRKKKWRSAMSWMLARTSEWSRISPDAKTPASELPAVLHIAGVVLRALFMIALVLITWRVSMPQSETIWTVYETPGDLMRMVLGLAVCVGVMIQLFKAPHDAQRYRTWLYLGLAAVPFAWICLVAVW
jgi:hypothetical protein